MTNTQKQWLKENGIDASEGTFSKGAFFVLRSGAEFDLYELDDHEDGDGEMHVATFATLKEALAVLRTK